jgi:hypothetical protein
MKFFFGKLFQFTDIFSDNYPNSFLYLRFTLFIVDCVKRNYRSHFYPVNKKNGKLLWPC